MKEYRIYGPPGCGKTTTLGRLVADTCEEHGSEAVLAASFTRTAARELVGRNLPIDDARIGTLHALCYRTLEHPKIIEKTLLKEWNAAHPTFALEGGVTVNLDDPYAGQDTGALDGDQLLQEMNRLRGLQIDRAGWPMMVTAFAEAWTDFKDNTHSVDFTDLIEQAIEERIPIPGHASHFFLDEVQDFSPLELALVRQWGQTCEAVYLVGDDDQCQPTGTIILTTCGPRYIEDLDPVHDRLVSYDRASSVVKGYREGYQFKKQSRAYEGPLITITTIDGAQTRCSPEHLCLTKWTTEAKRPENHVVYLMRKGSWFRIGWCRLFRADGAFHLGMRARLGQADAAWILRVCKNRTEASIWESILAARYRIPTITFREVAGAHHYTTASIATIFKELGDLFKQAEACLTDHGNYLNAPIWNPARAYQQRGGTSIMVLEACNLISGLMECPVLSRTQKKLVTWQSIVIENSPYSGDLYSLAVDKHHVYIADGIITHNCLYAFKGANSQAFLNPALPDEQVRILEQSYRVPGAIHEKAMNWIEQITNRMPKTYYPRPVVGRVDELPVTAQDPSPLKEELDQWLAEGKTVAFLASCSFMLDPLKYQLREWGYPFHNPYRPTRGDWNPLHGRSGTVSMADRVVAFRKVIDCQAWWTYRELYLWAAPLRCEDLLSHGAKTLMRQAGEDDTRAGLPVDPDDLERWFLPGPASARAAEGDLDWLQRSVLKSFEKPLAYAATITELHGSAALAQTPKILLGTIHSVKGAETDVVVLYPDLSPAGYEEWVMPGEPHDNVRRMFYVGMTRAKEELYWAQPSGMSIEGYL